MNDFRKYDPEKDKEAVHRIWKEIGWISEGEEEKMDAFIDVSDALVAELNDRPECLVLTVPGSIRYLDESLDLSVITSVSTSRVARKKGLAGKLTAKAIEEDAERGVDISALGMFEQGFYNRLGFGTGCYENWIYFDPADLKIEVEPSPPERIQKEDWKKVYEARINRKHLHGSCDLLAPKGTRTEMDMGKNNFGLGYFDESGEDITHHIWMSAENVESGPYNVKWMTYQDYYQFLELMSILRDLGDQVHLIRMREPPGIQIQDLLKKPLTKRRVTKESKFENKMNSLAYWQMRICDIESCLEKTHLSGEEIRFNLKLTDPIRDKIPEGSGWTGVGGEYIITLGEKSIAEEGHADGLPEMKASIGAFTRMWLGVGTPSGLAVTDEIEASDELLDSLDRIFRIPKPHPDWDF